MSGQSFVWGKWKRFASFSTICLLVAISSARLDAAVQVVNSFGDYGWRSDDTRDAAGNNLVGINNTNAGKPGQTPTAADDAAIAQQIKFVNGPAGSTYGGAVSIDGTTGNSGKSNISTINTSTGFAAGSALLDPSFSATYQWYDQPNTTSRTLGFKIGVQSSQWANSQVSFTAQRSGESAWDLVLVHIPSSSDNAWSTVSVDHDSGTWTLFRQAGNNFFPAPPPNGALGSDKTLDQWAADSTWGPLLFGPGAKVSSIQFGLGSSQRNSIAYVDYLQTSLLNGGNVLDFRAVPEASSVLVWAIMATVIGGAIWFRPRLKSV